ncbi:hypothetical protein [Bradyrhizobium brasilense]|uniref:hypothetical protein n=1 Tax=Bradyrhizobium brasilense TaxID=1419277 RepID=UPI001E2AA4D9|nr:hypothetical protein [Bradyrhizobium brasilense]MCC8969659.1 hypothetical protein [Bradyrhizobium brasilense]
MIAHESPSIEPIRRQREAVRQGEFLAILVALFLLSLRDGASLQRYRAVTR